MGDLAKYVRELYQFLHRQFHWGLVFNSPWLHVHHAGNAYLCLSDCAFPHRVSPVWRNFLFVVTVSPLLVSSVVRTYGWMVRFSAIRDQRVNGALMNLGIGFSPHQARQQYARRIHRDGGNPDPYMALSLIAEAGRRNASLEEAAASLGANAFTRFRRSSCHSPCRASHLAACFASCWQSAPSSH